MQRLPQTPQGLTQIHLLPRRALRTTRVQAPKMDTPRKAEAQVPGAGGPAALLVGDVVLHAGARVDLELAVVDGPAQAGVVLAGVLAVGVAQRVVDVLLGAVDAQALFRDLELFRRVAVGHEGEDPDLRGVLAGVSVGTWEW